MRAIAGTALAGLLVALPAADAHAQQPPDNAAKPAAVFVEGGFLTTSILSDTQDAQSGYLHYSFIGGLDWPVAGGIVGGGVRVARHVSVGAELALRRSNSTTISEQEHGHTDSATLSSLYTNDERLLSFVVRAHSTTSRLDVQPLGGMTVSWATRTLTGRHGTASYPGAGIPVVPVSRPDADLHETAFGLVGGADLAVHVARGVAIVGTPRVHWIARDQYTEYEHVVPNAGRVIFSIGAGVQWWPGRR